MAKTLLLYGALLGGGTLIIPSICFFACKKQKKEVEEQPAPHPRPVPTPFVSLQGVYLPPITPIQTAAIYGCNRLRFYTFK